MKTTSSGLLSDAITIAPKLPQNPSGTPGLGGVAAIPAAIGAIIGNDDFCSVWNFPLSAVCIQDPAAPGEKGMPAWCLLNSDWVHCPTVETPVNPDTGIPWGSNMCFDVDWYVIPCAIDGEKKRGFLYIGNDLTGLEIADHIVCLDINDRAFHCDSVSFSVAEQYSDIIRFDENGVCYLSAADARNKLNPVPCRINIDISSTDKPVGSTGYSFDNYMRVVNNETFMPVTNNDYLYGYPVGAYTEAENQKIYEDTSPRDFEQIPDMQKYDSYYITDVYTLYYANDPAFKIVTVPVIEGHEYKVVKGSSSSRFRTMFTEREPAFNGYDEFFENKTLLHDGKNEVIIEAPIGSQYLIVYYSNAGEEMSIGVYDLDNPLPLLQPGTVPEPIPDGSCTVICEWLKIINQTLQKIDASVLAVVSAVQNKIIEVPEGAEIIPFDDKSILDKLTAILKSIDDISVEVTKEAGTNFWDVLGGAFGDIFDLIEFLIEKVIYLVVPEDTSNINAAFETLNGLISAKMKPVEQIKTAVDGAMNVEAKTFEDIYITLPAYGEVKFFETDYIQIALPYVRRILSAMMILMTAFYAYRKVSSEMIR